MPLSSEPPRPPDGVGRQAIRSTTHATDGRAARCDPAGRLVEWSSRHRLLTVAVCLPGLVGAAVDWWRPSAMLVGLLVVLTPVSLVASVVLLVGSRSGGRR